jgi:hypothetical protein
MSRRTIANGIGCLSIPFSLSFWILVCLAAIFGHVPAWLDGGVNLWLILAALGFALAIIAASIGSRRWALAAALPFLSFIAAIATVALGWTTVQW